MSLSPHYSVSASKPSITALNHLGALWKLPMPGAHPQIFWFNWSEVGSGLFEKLPRDFLCVARVENHWLKGTPEIFQLYFPLYIKSPSIIVVLSCGVGPCWWVASCCDTHTCTHIHTHTHTMHHINIYLRSCLWQGHGSGVFWSGSWGCEREHDEVIASEMAFMWWIHLSCVSWLFHNTTTMCLSRLCLLENF